MNGKRDIYQDAWSQGEAREICEGKGKQGKAREGFGNENGAMLAPKIDPKMGVNLDGPISQNP